MSLVSFRQSRAAYSDAINFPATVMHFLVSLIDYLNEIQIYAAPEDWWGLDMAFRIWLSGSHNIIHCHFKHHLTETVKLFTFIT